MTGTLWDVAVVILIAAAALRGVWRGGFRELISLCGMLAGVLGGWFLANAVDIGGAVDGSVTALQRVGTFLVALLAFWGLGGLLGWLLERSLVTGYARVASVVLGLGVGAVKGALVAGATIGFLYLLVPQFRPVISESRVAEPVMKVTVEAGTRLIRGTRGAG